MSERLTWESCPECRRLAAVGWLDGRPVQFDCPNGCRLPQSRITTTFTSWPLTARRRPPVSVLTWRQASMTIGMIIGLRR